MEIPQLVLTEMSKERLGVLNAQNLRFNARYTAPSELHFFVPSRYEDFGGNPEGYLYDEIRELRLIYVPNIGWFQLWRVEEKSDGIKVYKECAAYSIETMLTQKLIKELEGEFQLVNLVQQERSLMHVLLPHIPDWEIGHIDGSLLNRQRSISITSSSLYAGLVNDIANAFGCIFVFDYQNFRINMYDITREFPDTQIYLSHDNLIKNSTAKVLTDDIITCLHVRGDASSGVQLDIAGVNPTGNDLLVDVSYFKSRMSPGLLAALNAYENLHHTLQTQYSNLLVQLHTLNGNLQLLRNNPPSYNVVFSNDNPVTGQASIQPALDSASGLSSLEAIHRALDGVKQIRIESNNMPFLDIAAQMELVEPMIAARRNSITNVENQIANIQSQLNAIVAQLNMQSHFTSAQWQELNRYFIFSVYTEKSMTVTDLTTATERQQIQQELKELGELYLRRASHPSYEFTIDAVNFYALEEFEPFHTLSLGETITLDLDFYIVKPLLLGVDLDFENPANFRLHYANRHTLDSDFSQIDYLISQSGASRAISFNLNRIQEMTRNSDAVNSFINGSLDLSRNELITSPRRTAITMDEYGLRARSYDWSTDRLLPYESWLTGSQLAFSNNNFRVSANLAVGRIQSPSGGGTIFGVVAGALVGNQIIGNNLHLETEARGFGDNPQMIMNENGVRINNASLEMTRQQAGVTNQIILDPLRGFEILRNNEQQVFIGADGNVNFRGRILGGSINIANGAFIVEVDGTVSITRGTLNIGNGRFQVDQAGNVTMQSGHFVGGRIQIGGTIIDEDWFWNVDRWVYSAFSRARLDNTCIYLGDIDAPQIVGQLIANQISAGSINTGHISALGIDAAQANIFNLNADNITVGVLRGILIEGVEIRGATLTGATTFAEELFSLAGITTSSLLATSNVLFQGSLRVEGNAHFDGGVTFANRPTFGGRSLITENDLAWESGQLRDLIGALESRVAALEA